MKSAEFFKSLEASKKAVFSFLDLARILGRGDGYAKIFIHRLSKRGLVRLERNKYAIKGINPFVIASNIVFPSYLSFISAYSYHNLTTQIPRALYVVTLKQRRALNYDGNLINFIKFNKYRFFGFKREVLDGKFLFVAEPEKAIVDSLYLPKYAPISETFFALRNAELNVEKLLSFAKRMGSSAAMARLGYLLESIGVKVSGELKPLPKNYVPLNPTLAKEGKKNRRWKLIINEALE